MASVNPEDGIQAAAAALAALADRRRSPAPLPPARQGVRPRGKNSRRTNPGGNM